MAFRDKVREAIRQGTSVEAVARQFTALLYEEFRESLVLARCFVTVPLDALPLENLRFVQELAHAKGCEADLTPATPVLSLMGTRGVEAAWNDRRDSKGHVGIPLVSLAFVDSIPMIASLLKELEVDLDWLGGQPDTQYSEKELGGGWIGTFYVPDASVALDNRNRPIISAQDFVQENGVRTVFGLGGLYAQGNLLTILFFTRDSLDKTQVAEFTPLIPLLRAATAQMVREKKFFAA